MLLIKLQLHVFFCKSKTEEVKDKNSGSLNSEKGENKSEKKESDTKKENKG